MMDCGPDFLMRQSTRYQRAPDWCCTLSNFCRILLVVLSTPATAILRHTTCVDTMTSSRFRTYPASCLGPGCNAAYNAAAVPAPPLHDVTVCPGLLSCETLGGQRAAIVEWHESNQFHE
jgi:hypothetical protein